MTSSPPSPSPRIDGARLIDRLGQLRKIGEAPDGGVTREAFGPDDVEARSLVASWMHEAGLGPFVDAATNLIARLPGSGDRWLASGSHLDTVVDGGWLDGAYGVVAALEVATALVEAGLVLRHGVAVVAFANEEGSRGTPGMTGSRALVGEVDADELAALDDEDVPLGSRLLAAGGDPELVADAAWPAWLFDGFVELHIEQGPVLASQQATLGVVTAITGRQALDIEITGVPNHAGTTPMDLRSDALVAGAEVVLALEELATLGLARVVTVGHLSVTPNVRNVVPGRAVLSAEYRDEDARRLDALMVRIEHDLAALAARRDVDVTVRWGQRVQPISVDPTILDTIRDRATASGHPTIELPSGAGHDAQIIGGAIPFGMLFVPSHGGVSHSPREDTDPADLVAGAQVLLDTIVALDTTLGIDEVLQP